jgi:hypothetical protein
MITPNHHPRLASAGPQQEIPLREEPAVGGMPTMARAPTVKAAMVQGIFRPSPAKSGNAGAPGSEADRAADEEEQPFMRAWFRMWSRAPIIPIGLAIPIPSPT